mmetsp:Transcript_11358/g.34196  ORF Transcript_11358/g.34196 Transcript_11358/m.34196 type:complete len:86 (-) Transcript_11358:2479-2736(-)
MGAKSGKVKQPGNHKLPILHRSPGGHTEKHQKVGNTFPSIKVAAAVFPREDLALCCRHKVTRGMIRRSALNRKVPFVCTVVTRGL